MNRIPYDTYRRQLAQCCHLGEIPEDVWQVLLDAGYVESVAQGTESFAFLQRKAAQLLTLKGIVCHEEASIMSVPQGDQQGPFDVLNEMLAAKANRDLDVRAFRQQVLGDELLEWEQVEAWIEQIQLEERELPTWWQLTLTVPADYISAAYALRRQQADVPPLQFPPIPFEHVTREFEACFLQYAVPDPDGIPLLRVTQIPTGGKLEHLHLISTRLAAEYGWEASLAAVFVLTGSTPPIGLISHQFRYPPRMGGPVLVLQIHSNATSAEVAAYYRRVRQTMLGIHPKQRGMGEKNLRLAAFIEQCPPLSKTETWATRMAAWNARVAQAWRYTRPSNLQRDYQRARRWLTRAQQGEQASTRAEHAGIP